MNGIKTHRINIKEVEKEKADQIMFISGNLGKYQVAIVMHAHGLTFCLASFSYMSVLCQYHSAFIVITV